MSNWKPATGPRPNKSIDPLDQDPPHHDPPSKRDYAAVWIALMRQTLGHPKPPRLPGDGDHPPYDDNNPAP